MVNTTKRANKISIRAEYTIIQKKNNRKHAIIQLQKKNRYGTRPWFFKLLIYYNQWMILVLLIKFITIKPSLKIFNCKA